VLTPGLFSISPSILVPLTPLPCDLYINSLAHQGEQKFIKRYREGQSLSKEDIQKASEQYHYFYLEESKRIDFFSLFLSETTCNPYQVAMALKHHAVEDLSKKFSDLKSQQFLSSKQFEDLKQTASLFVQFVENKKIQDLHKILASIKAFDFYTFDHSLNVAQYNISFLSQYQKETEKEKKAKHEDLVLIGLAGLLHDVGKSQLSGELINFPGKLSPEQRQEIETHPLTGAKMLIQKSTEYFGLSMVEFKNLCRAVLEHHENVNGTGYPKKLQGEEIHLWAKITAISDFFDALTTPRSYHTPSDVKTALAIMERSRDIKIEGTLFDFFKTMALSTADKNTLFSTPKELPYDFDPCKPHQELPFMKAIPKTLKNLKK